MSDSFGLIVAAIIAGLVAFFSLIIGKEQTVSDCRQEWIDELRKDVAAISGRVAAIYAESIAKREENQEQLWTTMKNDLTQLYELVVRTRLRLNPREKGEEEGPATKAVLGALKELEDIFASPQPEFHKLHPLLNTLVIETQPILKENWKRVRSGEPTYRWTKWITVILVAALIGWFLWGKR